jgi:membrane protein YdbS with pleckstrin-like domain
MSEINLSKLSKSARLLWIAITLGFLLSFLSVVVSIALAINDPSKELPFSAHFVIWVVGSVFFLIVMIWRSRVKSKRD